MTARPRYYVLDADGEPRAVADVLVWGAWFERTQSDRSRVVQQDYAEGSDAGVGVSTVFLGLDHGYTLTGPPVLWESLVFGTSLDGEMRRYTSRADALRGHAALLRAVQAAWTREQTHDGPGAP